jgi:hypothetical protein
MGLHSVEELFLLVPKNRGEFFYVAIYFFFIDKSMKGFESHDPKESQGKKLCGKSGNEGSKNGVKELMNSINLNDYKIKNL